jgi:hypothetical protein
MFSAPYAEEVKWLISCGMDMRHRLADGVAAVDLGFGLRCLATLQAVPRPAPCST